MKKKVWALYRAVICLSMGSFVAGIASKNIDVGSGYWYRCRCIHSAGMDTTSSSIDVLWM